MASSPKREKVTKRKLSGAATYSSSYNKQWEEKYPISPGRTAQEFRCNVCLCNVSCAHQGESDVKRHCEGANHIKRQKAIENTRSLATFGFTKATDPLREQVGTRDHRYCSYLFLDHYSIIDMLV